MKTPVSTKRKQAASKPTGHDLLLSETVDAMKAEVASLGGLIKSTTQVIGLAKQIWDSPPTVTLPDIGSAIPAEVGRELIGSVYRKAMMDVLKALISDDLSGLEGVLASGLNVRGGGEDPVVSRRASTSLRDC